MTDRLSLRLLRDDEYPAWYDLEIEEYARDITVHGNTPAWAAQVKAVTDVADALPNGLATHGHHVFVLELAGEPVGRLWLAEREIDGRKAIFIYDIHLDEAHRGRGLGRAAMELAESEAQRRGFDRMELNVFGGNEVARQLYRSMGYVDRAVRMGKDLSLLEPDADPHGRSAPRVDAIRTPRLELAPLQPGDAAEMVEVLADPVLYAYTGGDPPDLPDLDARYRTWAEGSPRASEAWLNWVVRLGTGGPAIGHVQATVVDDGQSADVAWLVGTEWQGRGYASEAARALVSWLEGRGVGEITAHIHEDHAASGRVAASAGLAPTAEIQGGEIVWRLSRQAAAAYLAE